MPLFSVQVVLHTTDGLPENYVTNNWHFSVRNDSIGEPTQAELVDGINGHIETFYQSLNAIRSPLLAETGHEIKWCDLEDPPPRFPKYLGDLDLLPAPAFEPLPSEVALVLSFQATRQSGTLQASRRNRLYMGPFNKDASGASGYATPVARGAIVDAAVALALTSDGANGWSWRVYSPKLGLDYPVADGWVDNAFDTQRRRGAQSTVRQLWVQSSES